ncbi:MAG TPA: hypothetical protein VET48_10095 [Steroidobacteraceae bacterium]|nr:hypothetical protein [Steroidobacteraceae bacterium]
MHRAFAAWLIAKSWRAPLAAAICGVLPLGLIFGGGIPVATLLARDARTALSAAIAGSAIAASLTIASGKPIELTIVLVTMAYFAPLGLAVIVRQIGSLRWAFQAAIVGASVVLAAIYLGMDNPAARWQEFLRVMMSQLLQNELNLSQQVLEKSAANTNWGAFVAPCLLMVLGWLFLGCWWHTLLNAPGAFGKDFQQLRLGKVLGGLAVAIVLASFALDRFGLRIALIDALLWIATIALALIGLAAAHRLKASGRVGRGWLTATYVLLMFPVTSPIVVMLLAGWGVADNWRRAA